MGTPMWLCYHTVSLEVSEMRPVEVKYDCYSPARLEDFQIMKQPVHSAYGECLGKEQKILQRYESCTSVTCIQTSLDLVLKAVCTSKGTLRNFGSDQSLST
jgi:hypothetical protein